MNKTLRKTALIVLAVAWQAAGPVAGIAQESTGPDPVPPAVERLTAALKEGKVEAIAGVLTPSTGRALIAYDAAARKARESRAALSAAIQARFQIPQRARPDEVSLVAASQRIERIAVRQRKNVNPTTIALTLDLYWKDTEKPTSKTVTLVRTSGAWRFETAGGSADEAKRLIADVDRLAARYDEFAVKTDAITREVREGKYASPSAVRVAWQQATRPSASKAKD